ncbi:MAG TPA: YqiA/YcfP family alpha/beta fold hydrolase [Erysipelotrichaceae bacterium]|nr:YqiA/YcfP family alpha/beta fold hydrolase [Erysipelotrichaceae bacterium]
MNWLKRFFKSDEEKPILYCVHGFGVRRTHEYNTLKEYFEALGFTVVIPEIFDQTQIDDINPDQWLNRVEEPLIKLISENKKILLIGFSMGGVIASYLASKFKVERLVLLAPAFEYITIKAIIDTVEGVARQIIKRPEIQSNDYPPLPEPFTNTFKGIVAKCKESIKHVDCPVLIFHGTNDETIPLRSSDYAYESIYHLNKRLFILKNVPHRILDERLINKDVLRIIHEFFTNEIIKVDL